MTQPAPSAEAMTEAIRLARPDPRPEVARTVAMGRLRMICADGSFEVASGHVVIGHDELLKLSAAIGAADRLHDTWAPPRDENESLSSFLARVQLAADVYKQVRWPHLVDVQLADELVGDLHAEVPTDG